MRMTAEAYDLMEELVDLRDSLERMMREADGIVDIAFWVTEAMGVVEERIAELRPEAEAELAAERAAMEREYWASR